MISLPQILGIALPKIPRILPPNPRDSPPQNPWDPSSESHGFSPEILGISPKSQGSLKNPGTPLPKIPGMSFHKNPKDLPKMPGISLPKIPGILSQNPCNLPPPNSWDSPPKSQKFCHPRIPGMSPNPRDLPRIPGTMWWVFFLQPFSPLSHQLRFV
ncbi:hypothetical protein Q9966_015970 [Columba livia]|nr:hypothetical protein Q9966_015970 [Columba livia]